MLISTKGMPHSDILSFDLQQRGQLAIGVIQTCFLVATETEKLTEHGHFRMRLFLSNLHSYQINLLLVRGLI